MKTLMAGLLCLFFWTVQAQENNPQKLVRKQTKDLTRLYQLDKTQAETVTTLHERYYQQLAEIAPLKAQGNHRAYLHKLRSIRKGLQFEIRQALRPDQLPAFEAEIRRQEQAYEAQLAALRSGGASKEKLDLAKIAIE